MKQVLIRLIFVFLSLALVSCQKPTRVAEPSGHVEVYIENDGEFPDFLVGKWATITNDWEFTFELDGRISNAMISMGKTRIIPGQVSTLPTKQGGKAVYKPGVWTVNYFPESKELFVEVIIDYIRIEMGESTLEGSRRDVFVGPISESENHLHWFAEWSSFTDYIAYTPEPKPLISDPNNNPIGTLIFRKVSKPE